MDDLLTVVSVSEANVYIYIIYIYYIGKILIIVPMCSGFSLVRRQASLRGHSALKLSLEQQKRFPALFAKSLTIV